MPICQTSTLNEYSARDILLVVATIFLIFSLYPLASLILHNKYYGLATNRPAPIFELFDANGKNVSNVDFSGQYVYLMFGYLRCPEVCHTQVLHLDSISRILNRDDVQFVYLSMDTQADRPSALRDYFDQRGDNFISLHASSQNGMQSIANSFNAGFRVNGDTNSDRFTIEHPARLFLIDPGGNLKLVYIGTSIDQYKVVDDFYRISDPI